jgi:hypothetical protein
MKRSVHSVLKFSTLIALVAILLPVDVLAQYARPRGPYVYHPHAYRPYYYWPYYGPYFWGSPWGPYGFYPSLWFGYYPHYAHFDDDSSLRVQVTPREAQVFVDGYYVGLVDSFDGTFQRLHLSPGDHVIEIYLEGFRTIRETMMFLPHEGYQIKRAMEPLSPGDPAAERPRPDPSARRAQRPNPPESRRERPPEQMREAPAPPARGEAGAVAVRVQPLGAIVLIDGEKWQIPEGSETLVVHLSEGPHRIEIQKQGYRTFTTEIRLRAGETIPLNVSLRTQ